MSRVKVTYTFGLVDSVYITELVRLGLDGFKFGLTGSRLEQTGVLDPYRQNHEDD